MPVAADELDVLDESVFDDRPEKGVPPRVSPFLRVSSLEGMLEPFRTCEKAYVIGHLGHALPDWVWFSLCRPPKYGGVGLFVPGCVASMLPSLLQRCGQDSRDVSAFADRAGSVDWLNQSYKEGRLAWADYVPLLANRLGKALHVDSYIVAGGKISVTEEKKILMPEQEAIAWTSSTSG